MGYLDLVTPDGRNWVICQDVYPFRIHITPGFASNLELQELVRELIPDVEEWQFSGRRFCPKGPLAPKNPVLSPCYAVNSRKIRQFDEIVVFAFHLPSQRDTVAARLTNEGFKFFFRDEPTPSSASSDIVVIVP